MESGPDLRAGAMPIATVAGHVGIHDVDSRACDKREVVAEAFVNCLAQEPECAVAAGLTGHLELHPADCAIRIASPVTAVVPSICQCKILGPELESDPSNMINSLRPAGSCP